MRVLEALKEDNKKTDMEDTKFMEREPNRVETNTQNRNEMKKLSSTEQHMIRLVQN